MLFKIPGFGSNSPENDPKNDASTDGLNPLPDVEPSDAASSAPRRRWPRILLWSGLVAGFVVSAPVAMLLLLGDMVSCGDMFKLYEGRSYAGSMNRAQQAHYLEHGSFATAWETLDLGIEPVTQYHRLVIKTEGDLVLNYALVKEEQIDDDKEMKRDRQEVVAYVGAVAPLSPVAATQDAATQDVATQDVVKATDEAEIALETALDATNVEAVEEATTQTILCMAEEPGLAIPPAPQLVDGVLTCAAGTRSNS